MKENFSLRPKLTSKNSTQVLLNLFTQFEIYHFIHSYVSSTNELLVYISPKQHYEAYELICQYCKFRNISIGIDEDLDYWIQIKVYE